MSRNTDQDSSPIFSVAESWRDRCLIAGQSLLWPESDIWSLVNLERFKICFIDRPDASKDKNFEQKFKEQLATEGDDVTRLACELLLVYFLFPVSVTRARKVITIDGKPYLWRDILALRKAQCAEPRAAQPMLFPLKDDVRPAVARTAAGRYSQPSLFDRSAPGGS